MNFDLEKLPKVRRAVDVAPTVAYAPTPHSSAPVGLTDLLQQLRALQEDVKGLRGDLEAVVADRSTLQAKMAAMAMRLTALHQSGRRTAPEPVRPTHSLDEICAEAAAAHHVTVQAIRGRANSSPVGRARYAFCEMAAAAGYVQKEISHFMGRRPSSMVSNILCTGRKKGLSWQT